MEDASRSEGARLWAGAQALARARLAVRGGEPSRVPPLLFLTDPERTPRPWEIAARMPPGSGVIHRGFGRAEALEEARRLRAVTHERGMTLLIGLDADLADAAQADGLHLPERSLGAAYALSGKRPGWLLTGAAHSVEAALAATDLHAVLLSPIFPAGGASAGKLALGLDTLSAAAGGPTPVIALGGVTTANVGALIETGCAGVASVGGVVDAFGR
ncbi:thiamine phosphate synthase [Brevundimonas bacteroides]|uniref:thiamine phosphate synthase n=1 Tax=Brevundimonas bacteroides TaxID=74311 RepID=UPI0005539BD8|nr:thiamine phosphate synthase [Brevundimonas bacteroides]